MREHVIGYFKGEGHFYDQWTVETPEYRADASARSGPMIGGRLDWVAFGAAAARLLPQLLGEPISPYATSFGCFDPVAPSSCWRRSPGARASRGAISRPATPAARQAGALGRLAAAPGLLGPLRARERPRGPPRAGEVPARQQGSAFRPQAFRPPFRRELGDQQPAGLGRTSRERVDKNRPRQAGAASRQARPSGPPAERPPGPLRGALSSALVQPGVSRLLRGRKCH